MYWTIARHCGFVVFLLALTGGILSLTFPKPDDPPPMEVQPTSFEQSEFEQSVAGLNAIFQQRWQSDGIQAAEPASEELVARRLSLALAGTIPSLEELRAFEKFLETEPESPEQWWIDRLLATDEDRRAADYLAERFARAMVGTELDPFIFFRRRRFVDWIGQQIHEDVPYDAWVREIIGSEGLWTDQPPTNFLTATIVDDKNGNSPNPEELAGKVSRAFLGMRLDCAQCHDHPFEDWTQEDFRGLAGFFGQARTNITGIFEDPTYEFKLEDMVTGEQVLIEPRVPFQPELLPESPDLSRRQKLAQWVTHPENQHFAQATVNRVWAMMFGRALIEPVDDLTTVGFSDPALNFLAQDFVDHGYNLERLIRVIAASEVFQLESRANFEITEIHEADWAVFPVTRLRPEQVVSGVQQAASIQLIDYESHITTRLGYYDGINKFVRRYGDAGADELAPRGGTIPQRLLMMNGKIVQEKVNPELLNASQQISTFARDDQTAVKIAYQVILTRNPTEAELQHFTELLRGKKGRARHRELTDLCWVLVNSTEFSWNH